MITERNRYDPELQMFAEQPRPTDLVRLRFLRWVIIRGYQWSGNDVETVEMRRRVAAGAGPSELLVVARSQR